MLPGYNARRGQAHKQRNRHMSGPVFGSFNIPNSHRRHREDSCAVQCQRCGNYYRSMQILQDHLQICNAHRRHQQDCSVHCQRCGNYYRSMQILQDHLQICNAHRFEQANHHPWCGTRNSNKIFEAFLRVIYPSCLPHLLTRFHTKMLIGQ